MLPSLTTRRSLTSPFDALWDMRREMDRLFGGTPASATTSTWTVPAEVIETDNEIRFRIDIPGIAPQAIDLTVENNVLTVSGERKWEREDGNVEGEVHVFERRYGRFQRSFALPRRVDTNSIEASYENGVLNIRLAKAEDARPRRIQIGTGDNGRRIESK
jgi:HSP20 family protein